LTAPASNGKPTRSEQASLPGVQRTPWAWAVATFFGIGYLKPGPGTWASVATVLLWGVAASFTPAEWQMPLVAALALVAIVLGIAAGNVVTRETGYKDPQYIVMDEVAGQLVTLVAAPAGWKYMLASLILFRCLDVIKPPPLRRLERYPGGFGVMLDEVAAGVYAAILLRLLVEFGPRF